MLRMARVWSKLLFSGTVALAACLVMSSTEVAQAAGEPGVTPPAAPGAKPSKDRFSKAMKRLREQRRNKAQREKSKAKSKRATTGHKTAPDDTDKKSNRKRDKEPSKPGGKIDLNLKPEPSTRTPEAIKPKEVGPDKPKVRRPAPPLPAPKYTELEQQLQRNLQLQVVDLGPDERWEVTLVNRGPSTVEVAADPRLLSFTARVPGKAKPVSCKLPEALLPKPHHTRRHTLDAGEQYTFTIDPLMYCFETGEQTILVPGTFLTPTYGFPEKTQTRWSWGRRYEDRLAQVAPFAATYVGQPPGPAPTAAPAASAADGELEDTAVLLDDVESSPSAAASEPAPDEGEASWRRAESNQPDNGLKQVTGDGFALRSEYQGWARARVRHRQHTLGEHPQSGLKLSITTGSDAPSARDIAVTVRLENESETARRVYFRRDLVSFLIKGPDGEHECAPFSAEFRAPDQQAFTTIAAGKSVSFTTQLLEFCPAESFSRAGFYYVSAVLPATAPGADEDVFTGKLAASKPRPVRLHRAELPFTIRRGPSGGGGGGTQSGGRFTRSPNAIVPEGEMIQPVPQAPEPPPPPPVEAPPPPIQ